VAAASNARRHQKRSSADVVVSESLEGGLTSEGPVRTRSRSCDEDPLL